MSSQARASTRSAFFKLIPSELLSTHNQIRTTTNKRLKLKFCQKTSTAQKLSSATFLMAQTKLPSQYAFLSSNPFYLLLRLLSLLVSLCSLIASYSQIVLAKHTNVVPIVERMQGRQLVDLDINANGNGLL